MLGVSSFALASRPDRNSFLDYKVSSVAQLIHEIRTDPAVADRFERHFGMNKERLIAYLKSLHRDTIRRTATYPVYSVPEDGHVKMHMQQVKEGEPDFADPNGAPVLLVKCGNPVTQGPETLAQRPELLTVGAPRPENLLEANAAPSGGAPEMLLSQPATPAAIVLSPVVAETSSPPPGAPLTFGGTGGSAGGGIGALGFLPIAGGIIWGIGGSGGHSHNAPVPEPSAYVGLVVGLVGLGLLRRTQSKAS